MAIYVDRERNRLGRMIMCHMVADTVEELHEMATQLGLKREWFQATKVPHYDVCLSHRKRAVELGAKEISRRQLVQIVRKLREEQP